MLHHCIAQLASHMQRHDAMAALYASTNEKASLLGAPVAASRLRRTLSVLRWALVSVLISACIVLLKLATSLLSPNHPFGVFISQLLEPVKSPNLDKGPFAMDLLSLNTFMRPIGIGRRDYKDARLVDLMHVTTTGFDIVCFQELFAMSGTRKQRLLQYAAETGGLLYNANAPVPGLAGLLRWPPKLFDGGLSIISRYPIVSTDFMEFDTSLASSFDYVVAKGVLYARVCVRCTEPMAFVHVFTTHLQANNSVEGLPYASVRHKQLQQLVSFVGAVTSDDTAGVVLLCGDFNVNARSGYEDAHSSEEYRGMMRILHALRPGVKLRDVLFDANNGSHPVTSAGELFGTKQEHKRLDYIFLGVTARAPVKARVVPGSVEVRKFLNPHPSGERPYRTFSDHFGVESNFRLWSPSRAKA